MISARPRGHALRTLATLALLTALSRVSAQAQEELPSATVTGQEEMIQPRRLIDMHTAGVLPRGSLDFETRVYPSRHNDVDGAGITFSIAVGITDRFMFGGGYGGDGLVGHGTVRGNPWPGLLLKYRIIEETYHFPGLAIGYDWQGYGGIEGYENSDNSYRGYVYKSEGLFAAMSKNYLLFTKVQFGIHVSVNYSIEEIQRVKWPNGYLGLDIGINEELAVAAEYNLALNHEDPNSGQYINPLHGFFNAGIRWAMFPSFYLEFNAKDIFAKKLLRNDDPAVSDSPLGWSRELKLVYVTSF
ncbi:MAG: hypothetical protein GF418_16785 [Chitinivibrionales bacterium]|nr:hypothetical protein [Chitinivibrionales bacterium]MBD3397278.1 hypothetical protein [Chitinivibrionales bacterium]